MYRTRPIIMACLGLALLLLLSSGADTTSLGATSTTGTTTTTAPTADIDLPIELVSDIKRRPDPKPTPEPTFTGQSTGTVNGYPCGGDLPPCYVLRRESGGNPRIFYGGCYQPCKRINGHLQTASGLWQITKGTWGGYGGVKYAAWASPRVQNEFAARLWNRGRGCSHWAACRR